MNLREVVLLVRLAGWSLALPLLKRAVPLPMLVRLVRSGSGSPQRNSEAGARLAVLVRRVLQVRGGDQNCLERCLLLYRYLPHAGMEPNLVVGFKRGGVESVLGHAWIVVDGRPFGDDEVVAAEYGTSLWFGPDGLRRQASAVGAAEP